MSGGVGPLLRAVRPRQWTKNALVCAGLLFAEKVGDVTAWLEALTIFVAYSTLSGAAYLINDVRDREADRLHPVKRWRPLASGALTLQRAIALAGTLALGGLAAAGSLGLRGLAKRRGELMLVHAGHAPGRRALAGYSLVTVERLFDTTAAITVLAYVAHAATAHDSRELLLTTPLVAFGVLRYRHLVRRHGLGEEPENVLLGDPPLVVAIVIWAALAAIILATA
jgi:4-hydroxybenzoate polyprenyltransferase